MNDETRIRELMAEISRAFQTGDVAALDGIFDDDFTMTEPSGEVISKQQWLADVASGDLRIESVESESFDLRRAADDAIRVSGRLHIRGHYSKANYNGTFSYLGVYRKEGEAWKLLLSSARRVG